MAEECCRSLVTVVVVVVVMSGSKIIRSRRYLAPPPSPGELDADAIPEIQGVESPRLAQTTTATSAPLSNGPHIHTNSTTRDGDGKDSASAKDLAQRGIEGFPAFSTLVYPERYLGYLATR